MAITLAFVVSGRTVPAVDGDLDPTFGIDGKVLTDFDHSTGIANAVAISGGRQTGRCRDNLYQQ